MRLVSCADKLHNARSILADFRSVGDQVFERFTAERADTLWYYRAVSDAFCAADATAIALELERVVAEIEALAAP